MLTHYHAVRVLGASAYRPQQIIASQDTYDLIVERGEQDKASEIGRFPRLFRNVDTVPPGLTWPTITFAGKVTLWLGKLEVQLLQLGAYRCIDAKQTVEWYGKYLGMKFVLAIAEDEVPSTKEPDPYMHVFLDAGQGNILAFFELPTRAPMDRDRNTPAWVQHLALEVDSVDTLLATKARLEADGIEVVGPTDHSEAEGAVRIGLGEASGTILQP